MATIGRYSRAKLQKIISGSAGSGGSGDGDVSGAASSTDNAVVRFNGAGGKTIQNSAVVIDDSNNVSGIVNLTTTGDVSIADDKKLNFGTNNDAYIEYDENGGDYLSISGSANGLVLSGSTVKVDGQLSILNEKKFFFGNDNDAFIQFTETGSRASDKMMVLSSSLGGIVLSGSVIKIDGTLEGGSPLKIGGDGVQMQAGSNMEFAAGASLDFSGSYLALTTGTPIYLGSAHDCEISCIAGIGGMHLSGSNISLSGSSVTAVGEITGSSNFLLGSGASNTFTIDSVGNVSGSGIARFQEQIGIGVARSAMTHGITLPNTSLNNSGSIKAYSYATYSSGRYKKDVEMIQSPLEKIKNIQGVSFSWKDTNKKDIGFIAEEVGKVIPEVVNFEENGQDAMSMDYARMTALLIEGVKEQQIQLDQQKKYISQLQKIIEDLKNNL